MEKRFLITIDTEALPARASNNHIQKLIWGQFDNGRAGIIEICNIIEEFGGRGLFFLEVADSFNKIGEYREVNSYLESRGHMVEWHFHPEILGKSFWQERGASGKTMRQDLFDSHDTRILLSEGLRQFIRITGRKPSAYRAGSFRWNQRTIDFLAEHKIAYSFNACRETSVKDNYETFAPTSSAPFAWSQGVREVPCGEVNICNETVHFRFPRRFQNGLTPTLLAEEITKDSGGLVNILLHSWSLLERDKDTGHYYYKDQSRAKAFRKTLSSLAKNMKPIKEISEC